MKSASRYFISVTVVAQCVNADAVLQLHALSTLVLLPRVLTLSTKHFRACAFCVVRAGRTWTRCSEIAPRCSSGYKRSASSKRSSTSRACVNCRHFRRSRCRCRPLSVSIRRNYVITIRKIIHNTFLDIVFCDILLFHDLLCYIFSNP